MPVTLEPFVRFTCFNFCIKALDPYFHLVLTAGASDPIQAAEFRRRLLQTTLEG